MMRRGVEDKALRVTETRAHDLRPLHAIDGVYVCEGAHDRSAPCHYREATVAERAEFRRVYQREMRW